jgi:hypothetical protein
MPDDPPPPGKQPCVSYSIAPVPNGVYQTSHIQQHVSIIIWQYCQQWASFAVLAEDVGGVIKVGGVFFYVRSSPTENKLFVCSFTGTC